MANHSGGEINQTAWPTEGRMDESERKESIIKKNTTFPKLQGWRVVDSQLLLGATREDPGT